MRLQYATTLLSLLALSITLEVLWIGNISRPPTLVYHLWHIALMVVVIAIRLVYQSQLSVKVARLTRILIVGMVFTTVGDAINSAISGVEPVTLKLSYAIVLFGIGYGLYVYVLYRFAAHRLSRRGGFVYRFRWLIVAVIAVVNTLTWIQQIKGPVAGDRFLTVGSFIVNAVIYTLLISLSFWYFWANRLSLPALPVFIGGLLIPISDLYLFTNWLSGGQDVDFPAFELYALNWILYFGGQVLFAFLPACEDDKLGAATTRM